ncbi:ABC transporter substrate-binding protein [Azoarcus sp. DD4]|uniref:ABC transporter substrate-binding protein n=1 Tax=Azoarcus sp. DD4 TaxID=2027405 RepID=UPI00143CC7B4|nr:ABC transporter substrate-binding protein [Azoarcus sp. DD4]
MRRRRFLQSLPALSVPWLSACQLSEEPLRIGANLWPGYSPLRLAEATGALPADAGRVLDFPSSSAVLTAFRNGAIDAAALTLDEVILLAANQQSPRIILVFDFSDGADVIIARAGLNRIDELRGKRIGVETEALGAYMVGRALARDGLALEEVEIVSLPMDRHEAAFVGGEVDALVTFEPIRSSLLARGGRQLFSSADIPGEVVDVLVVRDEVLRRRHADLRAVVRAYFAGRTLAMAEPDEAVRRLGVRAGGGPESYRAAMSLMRLPDRQGNRELLGVGPRSLHETLSRMAVTMTELKLIEGRVSLDGLLVSALVEEV